MKVFVYCCLCLSTLLWGCKKTSHAQDVKSDKVETLRVTNGEHQILKMTDFVDTIRYVKLETKSDNLIGEASQVIPLQDRIVVVDKMTHSVFFFDKDGTYLHKICAKGSGPEEYVKISSVTVDGQGRRVLIYDAKQRKILAYNLEGEYMKTYKVGLLFSDIAHVDGQVIAGFCDYGRNREELEKDGKLPLLVIYNLETQACTPSAYVSANIGFTEVTGGHTFSVDGATGEVSCTYPLDNYVYHIGKDGVTPQYAVDFGTGNQEKMTQHIQHLVDNDVPVQDIAPNGKACPDFFSLTMSLQSERLLFLSYANKKDGQLGVLVYDKVNKKCYEGRVTKKWPIENDKDHGFLMLPVAVSGQDIYSVIPSEYLEAVKFTDKRLAGLTGDDNPVIMISTVK